MYVLLRLPGNTCGVMISLQVEVQLPLWNIFLTFNLKIIDVNMSYTIFFI